MRNMHFNWNMYNFKINYFPRGQLVSFNLNKIFLPLSKILPCYDAFFGNLIFAIIAQINVVQKSSRANCKQDIS